MTGVQKIGEVFWGWLDRVAEATVTAVARVAAPRAIRLVETRGGEFAVQSSDISMPEAATSGQLRVDDGKLLGIDSTSLASSLRGSHVELLLRPDRFLFKPLELPSRASEFLDGIVRAQIDRLTPWDPEQAAFGCSEPADAGNGRIVVTVAATARSKLASYVRAFTGQGIRSVAISTRLPDAASAAPAIKVLQENVAGVLDVKRARRILFAGLTVVCLVAASAVAAAMIVGSHLQSRQDELARRILERRSAVIAARNAPIDPATAAQRALAQRKNETPASVIVLEVLSQILPDHTYVTELRIEGDKLRISGVTRDAPSLIRLIEQSQHFTNATFFAPTTRAPTESGDRFNIEARIMPVFSPRA
jgi:general secretion pathway protein L